MVIDKDESILDAAELLLASEGWWVGTYASGEAFLDGLSGSRLDCVVLEPHLPRMNGEEVIRSLHDGGADIPVIGLTAWPDSELVRNILEAGAHVVLTKPINAEELVEAILAAVAGRHGDSGSGEDHGSMGQ